MKSRILFRENGTVINTRSSLADRLRPWVLSSLVTAIVLVLPALIDPIELDAEPPSISWAEHLAELDLQHRAAQQEVTTRLSHAYQRGVEDGRLAGQKQCTTGSRL